MIKKINLVGEKSVSSFIHNLLMIILIATVFTYSVMLIMTICGYTSVTSNKYTFISCPAGANLALLELSDINKNILTKYVFRLTMYYVPSAIIDSILIYNVSMLFENFSLNKIFIMENFRKIRLISILFIVSTILENIAVYFAAKELINLKITGMQFIPKFNLMDSNYIYGLIIIVVSEIFRRAMELKEDQELTI